MKSDIESHIIGAVILENSYYRVADILKPANFTTSLECDHRLIWQCIEEMAANNLAIDQLTVRYQLLHRYNVNYTMNLVNITNGVCSAQHLVFWAYMLLELDIRVKFCSLIEEWCARLMEDPVALKELHQIRSVLSENGRDIFQVLEAAIRYLQRLINHPYGRSLRDFCNEMEHLYAQLDERVAKARKKDYYKRLKHMVNTIEKELEITPINNKLYE